MTTQSRTGLGIGCAVAAILLATSTGALVVGWLLMPAHSSDIDYEYGRGVGQLFVPMSAIAIGAGIAWARGMRIVSGALGVVSLALAGAVLVAVLHGRGGPRSLDEAQRATPVDETLGGVAMIVQRADGFAMPAIADLHYVPNDAVLARLLAQEPTQAEHWAAWRWTTESQAPMLMVLLDIEPGLSGERREHYIEGVIEGVEESPLPEGLSPYVHEIAGPLDHTFRSTAANGAGMFIRVFAYEHDGSFVVASITVAGADLVPLEAAARAAHAID